jgi:enoyl-CoA hydratase/carnithine racemase
MALVDVTAEDGVAVVTVARPPLNAIDLELVLALTEVFDDLAAADAPSRRAST